jgi:hypothetical protein
MATAFVEDRVLSLLERRLRDAQAPVNVKLWNGQAVAPPAPAPVTVTVRSPQALMTLANPSLGKLAKSYVEGEIDLEGNFRDVLRLSESLVAKDHSVYKPRRHTWKWWRHSKSADRRNFSITTTSAMNSTVCGWIATACTPAPTSNTRTIRWTWRRSRSSITSAAS